MKKQCSLCKLVKTYEEFNKDRKKKDGCTSRCKQCQSTYAKKWKAENHERDKATNEAWREANKERSNKNRKRYYERNREKILAQFRNNYNKDPLAAKDRELRKTYGIDISQYFSMLEKQNHSCAICGAHKNLFDRALAVDHCHKTGKVRGLLCTNCNRAVGNLKDSIELSKKLTSYLEKNNVVE